MEIKTALVFALLFGRNACAITTDDFSKRAKIPLERLLAIENGTVEITSNETYSISKVICSRKPIFWKITRYFMYIEIDDPDVIESFRKEILELPVNRRSELMSIFENYVPEGFGGECKELIEMNLILLSLFHRGGSSDDDGPHGPHTKPTKPTGPTNEPLPHKDLVMS